MGIVAVPQDRDVFTFDIDDSRMFNRAVQTLAEFNEGAAKLVTGNFAVAIAVLLHRNKRIYLPGSASTSTGSLQHDICDVTWDKDARFVPDGAEGSVYKPFTKSFKKGSGNNWRNSLDIQTGIGCDAPYSPDFLQSEIYLAQPRFDCAFRIAATGQCTSPHGPQSEERTCFNPNKGSEEGQAPPGPQSKAQPRPKLLKRGLDENGASGFWFIEPTVDSLAALLGTAQHRVPIYPFLVALYGGSPFWRSRGAEVSVVRLQQDLELDPERLFRFSTSMKTMLRTGRS